METRENFPQSVVEHDNVWIPMADGTRLAARIWIPENAEAQPVAAILEYLPYRKRDGTAMRDALTHPYFAGHNYACVRVDIRGNGESDGFMEDEYTETELSDGVAVIEWIAEQIWCNGQVGMMGISWGGFNSLQIAALNPAPLKAIITLCSTDDRYADDIHYKGGCLLNENLGWGATMLSYSSRPPDPALVENWKEIWLDRLKNEPFLPAVWLKHQNRDAYWQHGSICEDYGAIDAAVLSIGGWGDAYKNPVFRMLENLQAPTKAIVGPWVHKYPHFAVPLPQIGFLQEALRWWDRWLNGKETGVENDPVYRGYLMDGIPPATHYNHRPGKWFVETEWPSQTISTTSLTLCDNGLRPDGRLQHEVTVSTPLYSGANCGEYCAIWLGPEWPGDQQDDDLRWATFDSDPLQSPMDLVGAARLILHVASDKPKAQVAVRLCDVALDGTSHRITYGVLNLCHHKSHSTPELLEPGKHYEVEICLDDIAYRVPAGHRVRVCLSNNYWPLIWPTPDNAAFTLIGGHLKLPVRNASGSDHEVEFPGSESAPERKVEVLRAASNRRQVVTDQKNGQQTLEIVDDFGEVRDQTHGLIHGSVARESWSILPHDPLSARGDLHWTQTIGRDALRLRTEAHCSMWSDRENFYLSAQVEAFENDQSINIKKWDEVIPRTFL